MAKKTKKNTKLLKKLAECIDYRRNNPMFENKFKETKEFVEKKHKNNKTVLSAISMMDECLIQVRQHNGVAELGTFWTIFGLLYEHIQAENNEIDFLKGESSLEEYQMVIKHLDKLKLNKEKPNKVQTQFFKAAHHAYGIKSDLWLKRSFSTIAEVMITYASNDNAFAVMDMLKSGIELRIEGFSHIEEEALEEAVATESSEK